MNSLPQGAFSSQMKAKRPHGYQEFSMQQFTPEQMQLFSEMFGNLGPDSFLSKLAQGDQSTFDEMEAPAMRQFNEVQGNIASRFSGQGMGSRNSSAFQNATSAASQDFAGQLQANRQNLRKQAIEDLMGFSNQLLNQRPMERGFVAKNRNKGGWGEFFGTLGGFGAGAATGDYQGAAQGARNVANVIGMG